MIGSIDTTAFKLLERLCASPRGKLSRLTEHRNAENTALFEEALRDLDLLNLITRDADLHGNKPVDTITITSAGRSVVASHALVKSHTNIPE